jgi:hypothetical protein
VSFPRVLRSPSGLATRCWSTSTTASTESRHPACGRLTMGFAGRAPVSAGRGP